MSFQKKETGEIARLFLRRGMPGPQQTSIRTSPLTLLRLRCRLGLPCFHALHHFRMAGPFHVLFGWRSVEFGMEVVAPLPLGLFDFHRNAMSVSPGILANASHLPRDFHPGLAAGDLELVVRDFLG